MISFVWMPGEVLPAGTGGSENYTAGQVRELNRRGVAAQVVTVGLGTADGRDGFAGVPFRGLRAVGDVSDLDGTVVFIGRFPVVATMNPAYQLLHIPPPLRDLEKRAVIDETSNRHLIATSRYAAQLWSRYLDVDTATIAVAHPFAEPCFASQPRTTRNGAASRILYAGRLSPEKGIYTLMAMLHSDLIANDPQLTFTATTAGADKPQGQIIEQLLRSHPGVRLVSARRTPVAMAALMAEHDIVVMPSNSQYWHETFGIVSIEAQHAGCRVVASDDGGLPETDCGAITLVAPDDADALAHGIRKAVDLGPVSQLDREHAATKFTVRQSVDELLAALDRPLARTPVQIVEELETLASLPTRESRSSAERTHVRRTGGPL